MKCPLVNALYTCVMVWIAVSKERGAFVESRLIPIAEIPNKWIGLICIFTLGQERAFSHNLFLPSYRDHLSWVARRWPEAAARRPPGEHRRPIADQNKGCFKTSLFFFPMLKRSFKINFLHESTNQIINNTDSNNGGKCMNFRDGPIQVHISVMSGVPISVPTQ